jgi:MFS family permease
VRRGMLMFFSSVAYAISLVVFALVRSPVLAYVVLFVVGFTMILSNAVGNATLQHVVPNELRGRMMAAYSFVVVGLSQVLGGLSQVLGSVIGGSVAHAIGVSWAIGGGAVVMLAYSWWAFRHRPELRTV